MKGVTITMDGGEPTLMFWRIDDVREALDAARDMGLPLTSPPDVAEEILFRVRRALADLDMADPR